MAIPLSKTIPPAGYPLLDQKGALNPVWYKWIVSLSNVGSGALLSANNLSDVASVFTSRTNLGVPSTSGGGASGTWGINISGTAATVTTNASLTGVVTSIGNATLFAAMTANNVLLGNGTGTPLQIAPGLSGNVLTSNGTTWLSSPISAGTVTSVTFTGDGTVLSSTPSSAVTTSGTLSATLNTQSANTGLMGPPTGSAASPTFRTLVSTDIPNLSTDKITGNTSGTNASAGFIGQQIKSQITLASAISAPNGSYSDLTSITLTPGRWLCYGNIFWTPSISLISAGSWISLTSATPPDASLQARQYFSGSANLLGLPTPLFYTSVVSNTTVYISGIVALSAGTCTQCGFIVAERI